MKYLFTILSAGLFLAACSETPEMNMPAIQTGPQVEKAVAVVNPLGMSGVTGTVTFEKASDGVRVTAQIQGLGENAYGFHIHEYGDCRAADGTSAGGHFNPADMEHSRPDAAERHMGDMGNIQGAGENAVSNYTYVDKVISIPEILGRGIIVHEGTDDFVTQPTGDAGGRMACGVIGAVKSE